ncbi:MAG: hypothetical protein NC126_12190 [Clostridium sp.]|nr:hypothetical protein [Clostridium sp.]
MRSMKRQTAIIHDNRILAKREFYCWTELAKCNQREEQPESRTDTDG